MVLNVFRNGKGTDGGKGFLITLAYRVDVGYQIGRYIERSAGSELPVLVLLIHNFLPNNKLKETAKTALPLLNLTLGGLDNEYSTKRK